MADPHAVAESMLGPIRWVGPNKGFCTCPGKHLHTHLTREKDTAIFLAPDTGLPTVYCFHSSCVDLVREFNGHLRNVFEMEDLLVPEPPAERAVREALSAKKRAARQKAQNARSTVLTKYAEGWYSREVKRDSGRSQALLWANQFDDDALLWVGEPHEMKPQHFYTAAEFKRAVERAESDEVLPHFCGASTFKDPRGRRRNANVLSSPFFVVEGDDLAGDRNTEQGREENKAACWSLFTWMAKDLGMDLRFVVDSGNKSLHGWFRQIPDEGRRIEMQEFLTHLGCDPVTFRPAQPVRLPGAVRENGKPQTLYPINL